MVTSVTLATHETSYAERLVTERAAMPIFRSIATVGAVLLFAGCTTVRVAFYDDAGADDGLAAPVETGPSDDSAQDDATPDESADAFVGSCVAFPQSGCNAGQACYVANRGGFVSGQCFQQGAGTEGTPCPGGNSSCAAGFACFSTDGTAPFCQRYCNNDSDCSNLGTGSICNPSGLAAPFSALGSCTVSCTPLSVGDGGCAGNTACQIVTETTGARTQGTECEPAGSGVQGARCTTTSQCAQGFICITHVSPPSCARYCAVSGADAGCGDAGACQSLTPTTMLGRVTLGACF